MSFGYCTNRNGLQTIVVAHDPFVSNHCCIIGILYFIHGVIVFVIVAVTVVSHIIHNDQCDECKDDLSFILGFLS